MCGCVLSFEFGAFCFCFLTNINNKYLVFVFCDEENWKPKTSKKLKHSPEGISQACFFCLKKYWNFFNCLKSFSLVGMRWETPLTADIPQVSEWQHRITHNAIHTTSRNHDIPSPADKCSRIWSCEAGFIFHSPFTTTCHSRLSSTLAVGDDPVLQFLKKLPHSSSGAQTQHKKSNFLRPRWSHRGLDTHPCLHAFALEQVFFMIHCL